MALRKSIKTKRSTIERGLIMNIFHEYWNKDLKAEVIYENGEFGCNFYNKNNLVLKEMYPGKSEAWAESAAENYVEGIKTIQ
jgi:hypothetical protein